MGAPMDMVITLHLGETVILSIVARSRVAVDVYTQQDHSQAVEVVQGELAQAEQEVIQVPEVMVAAGLAQGAAGVAADVPNVAEHHQGVAV